MLPKTRTAPHDFDGRRAYGRIGTALLGQIFVPAEETTLDCQIINLSAGGAGIRCFEPPPLQSFVLLYIDGFGRFEGVTTRFVAGELGLAFVCKDAKRERLRQALAAYVLDGEQTPTRLRRHARTRSTSVGYFICPNGEQVACDVLDISLQGLSLRTERCPPIGEVINLGQTRGRVIRHHPEGIAIHFLNVAHQADINHGD